MQKAIDLLLPRIRDQDSIYLANNDTVLEPNHLAFLLETASRYPNSVVGACSQETWPDGTIHLVPGGFRIDLDKLSVTTIQEPARELQEYDALAARGLLIPAAALPLINLRPRLMPQHFADLAFTNDLKKKGFLLRVDYRATSLQIDRAGSAVESNEELKPSFQKKSALYLPALVAFWWSVAEPGQRLSLPVKFIKRASHNLKFSCQ